VTPSGESPRSELGPTRVLATTLKRLYPQNPDVVVGTEARIILDEFAAQGYAVVLTGCVHDFDPECARCSTLRAFQPWLDQREPVAWRQDSSGEWHDDTPTHIDGPTDG
jgi:hypothetical protein